MAGIDGFSLQASDISFVGSGLSRPECVVPEPDGTLWVSDDRSALVRIDADGTQTRVGDIGGKPNGFTMDRDGSFVVANIEDGKLYRVQRDGRHQVMLDAFEGERLGAVNFAWFDADWRLWVTISTRMEPRARAIETVAEDGYVLRHEAGGWRRVAEGFRFTNELRIDAEGRWLYVAETAAGCVCRLPFRPDGSLGPKQPFGPEPLAAGTHTDGIAFDVEGNLWVTDVSRNALFVIRPDGRAIEVFRDETGSTMLAPTSITFAGADLRTALVGSLRADRLVSFRAPVPGMAPSHWHR